METVVTIEVTCPACGDMFQTIFDASEEAARIAALEAENAELKARKEVALMDLCNEILSVFVEFGFATPEKGYASPGLLLSDLRTILKAKKGV